MNLSPPPAVLAAVVCLAIATIIELAEWYWRASHHNHRKGHR